MAKLRVYCACVDGTYEEIVAATSRQAAANMLDMSVYQLDTYGIDYDADSKEGEMVLNEPGVVFKKKKYGGDWFKASANN